MSYILDALKKSEAARETAPTTTPLNTPDSLPARPRAPRWLPVFLAVALPMGIAIVVLTENPPSPELPGKGAPAAVEPTTAPPREIAREDTAAAKAEPRPAGAETGKATRQSFRRAVPTLFELSEDIRMQIPPIMIEGHFFDENPARRMVVINGVLQREGRHFSNDRLRLDSINPESITVSFGETLFTMSIFDTWNGAQ